ncbi:hypothetical protein CPB84DRAFT_1846578 [Gymnopilus junonius]|uniref:Methyltransferase n=1 Tax=Gymnopilus junonius TaxID=109634 RepID=A0A9P5NQ65_GYMJU|nr:hypothetical protein CPB84DRAFT_1846578 [Gymnopilus junonius]
MSDSANPLSTQTKLKYSLAPPKGVRAYFHVEADPITGKRDTNYSQEEREVVIENIRGKEDSYTLDTTGFQYYKHPAKHTSFANDEEIIREYYPESIELIKKLTGASQVVLFDHTVRRRRPGDKGDSPGRRQPVDGAHVDQSASAAVARVHRHMPAAEVPNLLKKRFQIMNLWRPIHNAAIDWPLTVCDYRTVDPDDLFPVARIYEDSKGETLGVKYNPNHKWKYLYGMTPDELVLIKCADSIRDGSVASFTPHTGFEDPSTPAGTPARQSIEIRALVFYD